MTDTELPVRAGETIPFTPLCAKDRDPPPVYLLRVPNPSERAAYDRDVVARGAAYPDFGVTMATMRAAVTAILPAERRDEAFGIVTDFETSSMAGSEGADFLKAYYAYNRLEAELMRHYVPLAIQVAQQRFYAQMSQIVALQHFLTGWRKTGHAAGDFIREGGLTSEITLSLIPENEFREVADKAVSLIRLSQAKAKKSAPPVSSSSTTTDMQAASTTLTSDQTSGAGPSPSTT